MTEFYIVRHGQTLFNVLRRVQGWCDSPLTNEGIAQAKRLNETMKKVPFDVAFSSTQERAMDTLHYILEGRNVDIHYCKGLKEVYFGKLEGEYASRVFITGNEYPNGFEEAGGESIDQALERYLHTLKEIASMYPNAKVLIVSHGTMLTKLLQKMVPEFRDKKGDVGTLVPNGSLTKINYANHRFEVEYYSDTRYL